MRTISLVTLWICTLLVVSLLLPLESAVAAAQPVLVVFDVEDKGAGLSADTLARLSDYLSLRVGATARYRVVPRSQLKQRLRQQKQASHQRCYDQSCQVEIGRELAAQKSLSTVITKLGDQCMVTAVLYDLKQAASEGGGSAEGGCSEREIVASIKQIVVQLTGGAAQPPPAAPSAPSPPAAAGQQLITVDIASRPEGADVFIDGQARGRTPLRTALPRGTFKVLLERRGFEPATRVVEVRDRTRAFFPLTLSGEGRQMASQRSEWLVVRPTFAVTPLGIGFGGALRVVTLKWAPVFWDVLDIGIFGGAPETLIFHLLSTVGYPLYLGTAGQHQLKAGIGFGAAVVESKGDASGQGPYDRISGAGFAIAPMLRYTYAPSSRLILGGSTRMLLPLAGEIESGLDSDQTYDYGRPFALLLEFEIGFGSPL